MATVWIADDPVLSRQVAVKVLRADLAADDATRARFRHEAVCPTRTSSPPTTPATTTASPTS
jgi:serine/threonine-protein kinase